MFSTLSREAVARATARLADPRTPSSQNLSPAPAPSSPIPASSSPTQNLGMLALRMHPPTSHAQERPEVTPPPRGRKPKKGNEINPSPLRPNVPAAERLRYWSTPYHQQLETSQLESLPPSLRENIRNVVFSGYVDDTKSSYGAGLLRFTQFCDRHDIPETDRMPASYLLLVAFIGEYSGSQSGSAMKNWLSGLKAWHDVCHAPWHGDDRWVELARRTANREGSSFTRPLRPPVTPEHMIALRNSLDISKPRDAAYWAVACVCFGSPRRLAEATVASIASFNAKFNVTRCFAK